MKVYHSRKSIKEMNQAQVIRLHGLYIRFISIILVIAGFLSILAIWDYLSSFFVYSAPVAVLILWPWIMQSAFLARIKNEQAAS